jgi:hypothetical protein
VRGLGHVAAFPMTILMANLAKARPQSVTFP